MKISLNKLPTDRITRWGFLAGLLIAVGASVAWNSEEQYKLGGGFVGHGAGLVYYAVQSPLDPAGRTAALVVKTVHDDGGNAALLAAFGADTSSEGVGQDVMISRDTARWSMVAYGQAAGPPLQTKAIFVYTGTFKFTGPDNAVINYALEAYPASADADRDGFPDAGATPALTIPGLTGDVKRVPVP